MDSLKVLTEVVKTQSFTKSAENLYTSQPSISRDIKRLELEYDVKIFEFRHSKMSLTSDGEKLFQYALQRERLEQTLRHDLKMQPDTISGDMTVGSSYTYGEYRLSQHLTDLAKKYPELYIHVYLNNSDTVLQNIKNNTIDLGIIEKEVQSNIIHSRRIAQDEIVLIRKKSSSSNKSICFIRERGSGTRVYQENALSQMTSSSYLVEINNTNLIKNMVHADKGFSIVSKSTLTPYDLEKLEVTNLDITRYFYLVIHKNKYIDTKLNEVIKNLIS
ncbi:LysR substrate-binding domain-containing protein [Staphylococcus aureus]|uniref:LysR substrate-binding domain-containing protein n=1 Tax=Staphylococcus aureus TaxID=1280 RepID=UPI000A523D66|nr:LysR family transcriptional regulator [Staphylococcus aureus]MBU6128483.1 LysR family transcriptional regulator [Staphylococcus aureus]HAY0776658.1 LysR family transcriptional regulator [Staphylococcus aureus]HCZ8488977.1 LysR family transcriptional regulator [Staphylococcus aureus]HDF6642726.1 LysR family transcriptional regulator [Staphylococcus aureus]HDF7208694.1 LysR family transcriptional regulator [Staphylococcus aureus]